MQEEQNKTTAVYYCTTTYKEDRGTKENLLFSKRKTIEESGISDFLYEKDNHLGNVNVTISDKKLQVDKNGDGVVDWYRADVRSVVDMYPGGMMMPNRNFNPSEYRFGMNGQEKVDEISGSGNHNTALFWEYDTRIIRRWNLDPNPVASISLYNCFAGNPIWYSDILGDVPGDRKLGPDETPGPEYTGGHTNTKIQIQDNTTIIRNSKNIKIVSSRVETSRYSITTSHTYKISSSSNNIRNISNTSAEVIGTIMSKADISSINVTSTQRTSQEQAVIMYDNIIDKGTKSQYRLYGSGGDAVIKVFETYSPQWCCTKDEAIGPMTEKINEVGPSNVSLHTADPLKMNVIDIAPSSISNNKAFKASIKSITGEGKPIKTYIPPGDDPAHHIEIPKK